MAARRVRVRVHIDAAAVASETAPGGQVFKYLAQENRLVYRLAVRGAPLGATGVLKRSHINAGVRKVGPYSATGTVNNVAEHAPWVHDGTTGPIRPKYGDWLVIPRGRGGRNVFVHEVAGQRANPWLYRAGVQAAAMMGGTVRRGRV